MHNQSDLKRQNLTRYEHSKANCNFFLQTHTKNRKYTRDARLRVGNDAINDDNIIYCSNMYNYLHVQFKSRQVAERHRMERVVERGRVEFQQHVRTGTDDIRYRVTAAQPHQYGVRGQRSVVHRQIVLDHVALVPNPAYHRSRNTINSM